MNLLKLQRHKAVSALTPTVYVNIDAITSIEPFREDGSIIRFQGKEKQCFYNTPDEIIELMKGLFDDVRTSE